MRIWIDAPELRVDELHQIGYFHFESLPTYYPKYSVLPNWVPLIKLQHFIAQKIRVVGIG